MIQDPKPAGFEAVDPRSGYVFEDLFAYKEPRDQAVHFFVRGIPRGRSEIRYRLRAEVPGEFHALPAVATGMYAPELIGNSDEFRVSIAD